MIRAGRLGDMVGRKPFLMLGPVVNILLKTLVALRPVKNPSSQCIRCSPQFSSYYGLECASGFEARSKHSVVHWPGRSTG